MHDDGGIWGGRVLRYAAQLHGRRKLHGFCNSLRHFKDAEPMRVAQKHNISWRRRSASPHDGHVRRHVHARRRQHIPHCHVQRASCATQTRVRDDIVRLHIGAHAAVARGLERAFAVAQGGSAKRREQHTGNHAISTLQRVRISAAKYCAPDVLARWLQPRLRWL